MTQQPYLALITPLSGDAGGGRPDNSLPGGGGGGHPGNRPPGSWGGEHPGNRPPGSWDGPVDPGFGQGGGEHPGNRPPGSWGGPVDPGWGGGGRPHPGGGPMPGGERPDNSLPPSEPPPGGETVPEDVYTPAPVPEEIASQYVVSVYNPKTMEWTTKSYPPR